MCNRQHGPAGLWGEADPKDRLGKTRTDHRKIISGSTVGQRLDIHHVGGTRHHGRNIFFFCRDRSNQYASRQFQYPCNGSRQHRVSDSDLVQSYCPDLHLDPLYAFGTLFRPLLWAFNAIVGLFPKAGVAEKPVLESRPGQRIPFNRFYREGCPAHPRDEQRRALLGPENLPRVQDHGSDPRITTSTHARIQGILQTSACSSSGLPAPNPGVAAHPAGHTTPTTKPIISFFPDAATKTLAAAFTQIAASPYSTATDRPTTTLTATATPMTTLTPSGALLHLWTRALSAGQARRMSILTLVALASGVELPILASSSDHKGWWLVIVRLSVSRNAVCWIENGTVEGNPRKIPSIVYTPQVPQ